MFFASVSGGLVALSLMATAAKIGTAFYVLALTVLLTLSFVELVTFDRVLQNRLKGSDRREPDCLAARLLLRSRTRARRVSHQRAAGATERARRSRSWAAGPSG